MWKKVNTHILNKRRGGGGLPSEILINGSSIEDQKEIADKLNEYFVNKGHILASKLPGPKTSVFDTMKPRNQHSLMTWVKTNKE